MPNTKPRSAARATFANPIFWALLGAYLAGRVTPLDAPDWIGPASALACAILAGLIEHWYVQPRTAVPSRATKLCVHAPWAGGCTRSECQ